MSDKKRLKKITILQKVHCFLWAMLLIVISTYAGSCSYRVLHHMLYPQRYVVFSAPWYTGILFSAVPVAGAVVVLLILMYGLRRWVRKLCRPV